MPKKKQNTLGQIIRDDFDRASLGTSWTAVLGAATATITSNELMLAGGTGLVTEYIKYNPYSTCLEKWNISVPFKCTEKSATSYGFAIGVRGTNNAGAGQRSVYAQLNLTTGANSGKTFIRTQTGVAADVVVSTSSTAITFSLNDEMELEFNRNQNVVTTVVYNRTTGTSMTHTYTFPVTYSQTNFIHATGMFGIYLLGGTQTVHNFIVNSVEKTNSNTCMVGDSITYGIYGTDVTTRWSNQTMLYSNKTYAVLGGPGDDTTTVLSRINEILLLNPKYVILMIGGNDILYGVASGTYEANYTSIVQKLKTKGIKVIHCLATPRDTTNMTTFNNWISSTFITDFVADTFTPLKGAGTDLGAANDSGDGVHPNTVGHALIGSTNRQRVPHIFN